MIKEKGLIGFVLAIVLATIAYYVAGLHKAFDSLVLGIIFGMIVRTVLGDRPLFLKGFEIGLKFFFISSRNRYLWCVCHCHCPINLKDRVRGDFKLLNYHYNPWCIWSFALSLNHYLAFLKQRGICHILCDNPAYDWHCKAYSRVFGKGCA